jgi:hypothetical protein
MTQHYWSRYRANNIPPSPRRYMYGLPISQKHTAAPQHRERLHDLRLRPLGSPTRAPLPFLHTPLLNRTDMSSTPRPPLRPERGFESPTLPLGTIRPSIERTYERYTQDDFGSPVAAKDLGGWLDVFRRDHGQGVIRSHSRFLVFAHEFMIRRLRWAVVLSGWVIPASSGDGKYDTK